ncbi:MAPEG family protein [Marinibaculum pumilum]|uniref:MAPEG family protein n=1 Tax=Marinibaculum pumilum TaxID=1766165 RepID=A0ABV7KYB0_9PROT
MAVSAVVDAAVYAGLLALLYLVLSVRLVRARVAHRARRTAATQAALERADAAATDFAGSVPLALIVLALCDLMAVSPYVVHVLGLGLLAARLIHAVDVSRRGPASTGAFAGITLTWLVILGAAALLLLRCLQYLVIG